MTERVVDQDVAQGNTEKIGDTIVPLSGEAGIPNVAQRVPISVSKKGLAGIALLVVTLAAMSTVYVQRWVASFAKPDDTESKRTGDRPAAASTEPKKLDLTLPRADAASSASVPARIPALVPTAAELAEPIGVRRSGSVAPAATAPRPIPPEDAPAVLLSSRPGSGSSGLPARLPSEQQGGANEPLDQTRRNLDAYRNQLQGLLDTLTKTTAAVSGPVAPAGSNAAFAMPAALAPGATPSASGAGLFGGQLQGSATPRVAATMLGNRSLILPKGTAFTCALKTKVVSAASGFVGCQVQRNVYSDDGRVLLIERGSHMDGEYRITSVRPGTIRIPVLWVRIRTPNGVTVDIDSPGTGALGESGVDGYVDNRWGERIGAAMLLSVIDDAVKFVLQKQASETEADTVLFPSTAGNASKLAEKVLDSTINIPPLIYQNQGAIVGIYVARDVDFSSVYELQPTPR